MITINGDKDSPTMNANGTVSGEMNGTTHCGNIDSTCVECTKWK